MLYSSVWKFYMYYNYNLKRSFKKKTQKKLMKYAHGFKSKHHFPQTS